MQIRYILMLLALLSSATANATLLKHDDLVWDDRTGLAWHYSGPTGALLPEDLIGFRYATASEVGTLVNTYILSQPCGNYFDSPCATPQVYNTLLAIREDFAGNQRGINAIYDPNDDFSPSLRFFVHDDVVFLDRQNVGPPPLPGLSDIGMLLIAEVSPAPEPQTLVLLLGGIVGCALSYTRKEKR